MNFSWRRALRFTLLASIPASLSAQVHPFEAPPKLKETTALPQALLAVVPKTQPPQTCDPQGSVTRAGNEVSVRLDYVLADFIINNPDPKDPYHGEDPVRLRSYGGCKAGPTLEVFPGNTLRIDLVNNLSANDPSCLANPPIGLSLPPLVDCFNTINLHTHGLHVSPAGNSDNVLLNIAPQTDFTYEYYIPSDHPAGTFWYHAHRHGSTAVQVASGASGILIVRGTRPYKAPTPADPHPIADIDTILHTPDGPIPEQLFLFQQIPYACFDNDPNLPGGPWQKLHTTKGLIDVNTDTSKLDSRGNAPWICPVAAPGSNTSRGSIENFALQLDSPTIWDTNGRFTSVNGIVEPTLTLAAGEIQRWRFVHSGIHDTINLQIVRAAGPAAGANLVTTSGFTGNRLEQKADVDRFCPATPQSLIPQFEIAEDGLTRTHVRTLGGASGAGAIGSNYMQPGYRSDVLVVFPEDGDYCLLDQAAFPAERPHNGKGGLSGGGQGPSTPQLLAYIHVRGGHAVRTDLRAYVLDALYNGNPQLPAPVRDGLRGGDVTPWAPFTELAPAPATNVEQAAFAITVNSSGTALFQINGKSYDPDVVNFTRQVNTTDDWLLSASGEPHIFHIHVNPFEVIDVTTTGKDGSQVSIFNAQGECNTLVHNDTQGLALQYCGMHHVFRDTIFVENNYQVHIRTHYDRYIGEFVIHCHILDHEDGGMMLNIEIVPDLKAPGGGLGMAHRH